MTPINRLKPTDFIPPKAESNGGLTHEFENRNGDTVLIASVKGLVELGYSQDEAEKMASERFWELEKAGFILVI